jgi:2-polyprenyl-6-methoxyphenol hydroxylase-like FAD-dependent oxidoreductase
VSRAIPDPSRVDALVIGAGPAGASAAFWLAQRGHSVLVVEKKRFPREKTCGDGLTPRAVRQLVEMELADPLRDFHRYDGLRSIAHGITLELAWPEHPDFPPYGYVVRRRDLDEMVAGQAVKAGATVWQGAEAVAPLLEDGLVTGAAVRRAETGTTETVRARYVIVADGANSRFGRALGTSRDRSYAMPSPLTGLMAPAASPATIQVGPTLGSTDPPVGRRPPVAGPHEVSGEISQRAGAVATNASINLVVLTALNPVNVSSRPAPTFTVPSPTGKIHP